MSTGVTFFESVLDFSLQSPVTTSEFIPLPSSVPLSLPAPVPDISTPMSSEDTIGSYASKPHREKISDMFILINKESLPLNEF